MYAKTPQPDLIILDLKIPKKTGQDVLAEIKNDSKLKCIPVVVLTILDKEKDIIDVYNLHANCYIIKPVKMKQYIKAIHIIWDFWFSIVNLPKGEIDGK